MKKWLIIGLTALLALSLTTAFATDALEEAARGHVPQSATLIQQRTDDGLRVYRYWDEAAQLTYEVEMNPASGAVAKLACDPVDDSGSVNVTRTEAEAEAAALAMWPNAAVQSVRLDTDDGRFMYKVYFATDAFYGTAEVNPETGALVEWELDYTAEEATQSAVDEQGARQLVLDRLSSGSITAIRAERDDGRLIFEGKATDDSYLYEFEIDASTGRFLEWERERLKESAVATSAPGGKTGESGLIGTAAAKDIALTRAGGGNVTSIKLDREDGRQVYEGKVIDGDFEYEFEIDADTGEVLDWEKERVDD